MTGRPLLLPVMLMSALAAQDRRPCLGSLVDLGGKPVAGATVTCVYTSPGDPTFLHDEQSVATDEHGRFRVELWQGISYAVWAIGPAGESGGRLATRIHYGATGGGYLQLTTRGRQPPRELRIDGLEPWRRRGAVELKLHCGGKDVVGTGLAQPNAEGLVALPPTPLAELVLVVNDAQGAALVLTTVDGENERPHAVLPEPVERVVQIADGGTLPAGTQVQVMCQVPLAWGEGELFGMADRFLRGRRSTLGIDGRCRVILPAPRPDPDNRWWRSLLLVAHDDTQPRAVELVAATLKEIEYCKDRVGADGEVQLRRLPDERLRLGLPESSDAPPGGFLVLPRRGPSSTFYDVALPEVVGSQGLRTGLACGANWAGLEIYRRAVAGEPGSALQCVAFVSSEQRGRPAVPAAPLETVVVTVEDADAGPARDAWVCIEPLFGAASGGRMSAGRWQHADNGGRVVRRLAPGDYGVHVTDGAALGVGRLTVVAGCPATARIALEQLPTVSFRVLGRDGEPSAGALVWTMVYGDRPQGMDELDSQHFDVAQSLAYRLSVLSRTDAKGEITFPVIPVVNRGAHCSFRLVDGSESAQVPLDPGAKVIEVR